MLVLLTCSDGLSRGVFLQCIDPGRSLLLCLLKEIKIGGLTRLASIQNLFAEKIEGLQHYYPNPDHSLKAI